VRTTPVIRRAEGGAGDEAPSQRQKEGRSTPAAGLGNRAVAAANAVVVPGAYDDPPA